MPHDIRIVSSLPYDNENVKKLCRKVKEETPEGRSACAKAAIDIARDIPNKSILVPIPTHDPSTYYTVILAIQIAMMAEILYGKKVDVKKLLKGEPHPSLCELKEKGKDISDIDTGIRLNPEEMNLPLDRMTKQGWRIVLVDNVIDTGKTVRACLDALGDLADYTDIAVIGDTGNWKGK